MSLTSLCRSSLQVACDKSPPWMCWAERITGAAADVWPAKGTRAEFTALSTHTGRLLYWLHAGLSTGVTALSVQHSEAEHRRRRYMVILNFKTWCSSFSWATEIKTTPHVMLKSLHIHIQYCRLTVTGSAYPKQNASPLLRLYARDTLQGSDSWWWVKKTVLGQHDS